MTLNSIGVICIAQILGPLKVNDNLKANYHTCSYIIKLMVNIIVIIYALH